MEKIRRVGNDAIEEYYYIRKKEFNRKQQQQKQLKKFKNIKICNEKHECQFKLTLAEYGLNCYLFSSC